MNRDILNYEAMAVCDNGAKCNFDFHADNAALASDHIKCMANSSLDFFNFDKPPDKIHNIRYKKKTSFYFKMITPSLRRGN